jgi:ribosomal protein L11 methyltransferase (prmA)
MEEDATATYPQLETIPMKIAIDAQQAFGTGTHETTQMIVSLLLNQDLKEKRVLDCGCGTGILGIVAAKCGAKEVVSYDIDEWSVRNAEHNAELNGVELDVLEGDRRVLSHVSGVFDVILANINRNIILEDIDEFVSVMTTESKIILSGFYEQDAEAILQKANELGLKENQRLLNHDWCCLLLERQ